MALNSTKKGKYNIELIILSILLEGECYGYQLSQLINEKSHNLISVAEGSLYPALYRLEDNGYVSLEKRLVGKRKTQSFYKILPEGVEYFELLYDEYQKTAEGMRCILEGVKKLLQEEINE